VSRPRAIAVVGASLAGLRAVEALRREGFDGRLALIGAERHLPYDRPPLSKRVLAGTQPPEEIALRRESWEELGVELRLGARAAGLDLARRELALEGGERVAFDGLVVATGAAPRRLPGTAALAGVHVLRTLDDALALRAELERGPRVAVIGAGFIGAEVAATCRKRGLAVTLVEALPRPLARALPPALGELMEGLHRDHGVDVRCGAGVARLEGDGRVEAVALADGARVPADVVVVGIGVAPETAWLEGSGLALGDGVVCDASLLAAPGVVAAGDCARWPNPLFGEEMRVEHWTNAVEQGEAAARRLLAGDGGGEPFAPVPYFWSDQYDRKLQFAGRARPDDELHVVQGSLAERRFAAVVGRAGRLVGAFAMNRPAALIKLKRQIAERAPLADALATAAG
jgi:3-phenylpropionate/trans-cinnamate dioxygenase ferredoxin reductase subunit